MGTTSANLTVTIVTRTAEESLLLDAEIVASDNDGSTTYYISTQYFLRLHKSTNITSIASGSNVGTLSFSGSGLTASVPYEGEDDEYLVFSGSDTADLDKTFHSNLSVTQVGTVFDENGSPTSYSLTYPEPGQKTVLANKNLYGVFKVTYTTSYDKWGFSSGTAGPMLIFFIGTGTIA